MHIRQSIRSDLVSAITGLVTTGSNVFENRVYPLDATVLPALLVYSLGESIVYQTMGSGSPRTQKRTVSFAVEAHVRMLDGYDDALDDINSEVEAAIYADLTRDSNAFDTRIERVAMDYLGDADQPIANMVMTVVVDYPTTEGSPTT